MPNDQSPILMPGDDGITTPENDPTIFHQLVIRDAAQSRFGTNPNADEIIKACLHLMETGVEFVQSGGGTFTELFAKHGLNEWEEQEKLFTFFKDLEQSFLFRGFCGVARERQRTSIINALIMELARMNVNVIQNFNAHNGKEALDIAAEGVRIARAEGHDIRAQLGICIENNPRITIDSVLLDIENGLKGYEETYDEIYLKCANGDLNPDFAYEMTRKICERFENNVVAHIHHTFGNDIACHIAIAAAARELGKKSTHDCLPKGLAGSTGHCDIILLNEALENTPVLKGHIQPLNKEALAKDYKEQWLLGIRHRKADLTQKKDQQKLLKKAGFAGGAIGSVKQKDSLEKTLASALKTENWDKITSALLEKIIEIKPDFGHPTRVTPNMDNLVEQAAWCICNEEQEKTRLRKIIEGVGEKSLLHPRLINDEESEKYINELAAKKRYKTLSGGMVKYLLGELGPVPKEVKEGLIEQARNIREKQHAATTSEPIITDKDFIGYIKQKLRDEGIEYPTDRQVISHEVNGIKHVVACHFKENKPNPTPIMPSGTGKPIEIGERHRNKGKQIRDIADALEAAGGSEVLLGEIPQIAESLYKRSAGITKIPDGEIDLRKKWDEQDLQRLYEILNPIPEKLREARFAEPQIKTVTNEWSQNSIYGHIKVACDLKGEGFHDHMIQALEEYKTGLHNHMLQTRKEYEASPEYLTHQGTEENAELEPAEQHIT